MISLILSFSFPSLVPYLSVFNHGHHQPAAQIVGSVGFNHGRLGDIPDDDDTPEDMNTIIKPCFEPSGTRPTLTHLCQQLQDAYYNEETCEDDHEREFICPLSFEWMRHPVVAEDGISYGK